MRRIAASARPCARSILISGRIIGRSPGARQGNRQKRPLAVSHELAAVLSCCQCHRFGSVLGPLLLLEESLMRVLLHLVSAVLIAIALTVYAQEANLPAPGTRGNADNVKYLTTKSDPSKNPIRLAKATGHVSNYSEDKVPAYTLPDPLVTSSGERVTTAEMWCERRRPEILKLYQTEIYGRIPANAPKVTW